MYRNAYLFCSVVLTLAGLSGCSGGPSAEESKKAATAPDKIQGKVQEVQWETTSTDVALNAGGPSVYLLDGLHRYRLFFRKATEVDPNQEYIAEGVWAQKAIDEIGDPDQGKNGYPLQSSCAKVVTMAWGGLAFDDIDAQASVLRTRVNRYPARPLFLVARIRPATEEEITKASGEAKKVDTAEGKKIPQVEIAWEKERASLTNGQLVQTAPLWDPKGGTAQCKVVIDTDGKISELETGMQLCESVEWSEFRFQPLVQAGHPVKVETEVEIRFEPRK